MKRTTKKRGGLLGYSCGLLLLLVAPEAAAQANAQIDLNRFQPTPAGDAFFSLPSPFAKGEPATFNASVLADMASGVLSVVDGDAETSVVERQVFVHVGASVGIMDRALVSLTLPVGVHSSGEDSGALMAPSGTNLGDLRIGLRILLYGQNDSAFQIGTGAYLWAPIGAKDAFVSDQSLRQTTYLSLGGRFDLGLPWLYTASGGVEVRGPYHGTGLRYGAGLAALLLEDDLQIGPEVFASTPLSAIDIPLDDRVMLSSSTTSLETMLGAKYRVWQLQLGGAGSVGLTGGVGTPSYRFVAGVSFVPIVEQARQQRPDVDEDGIEGAADDCPNAFGPRSDEEGRNGCPALDDDEDSVPNHRDDCPNVYAKPVDDAPAGKVGCPI